MTDRQVLDKDSIQAELSSRKDWQISDCGEFIEATYTFDDFQTAFAFMVLVAQDCEAMDHHPNWSNVYNTVHISLTTHDSGGVTALDLALADVIIQAAENPFTQ